MANIVTLVMESREKTGKGEKTLATDKNKLPENTLIFDDLFAFSQFLLQNKEAQENIQAA